MPIVYKKETLNQKGTDTTENVELYATPETIATIGSSEEPSGVSSGFLH